MKSSSKNFPLEEIKGFIRKPIQTEDLIQFTNKSQGSAKSEDPNPKCKSHKSIKVEE